jgi:iron-sulfur cluster assembly protein
MKSPITVTDTAQERIHSILEQQPNKCLLLGVNNKGCSGHSYTFDLIEPSQINRFDEILHINEHKVVISAASLLKLLGSTLDWHTDKFGSRFVWHNPSVVNTCGCGESVSFGK